MDKQEAKFRILMFIEQVKDSGKFDGKVKLKNKLIKLYDMVDRYKPSLNYYEFCVKEAEMLFNLSKNEIVNRK